MVGDFLILMQTPKRKTDWMQRWLVVYAYLLYICFHSEKFIQVSVDTDTFLE